VDPIELLFCNGIIPDKKVGKPYQHGFATATQGFCPLGIWETVNCARHEFVRGFPDYLDVISKHRAHVEEQCEAYLREVHALVPGH